MLKKELLLVIVVGLSLLPVQAFAISSEAGKAGANFLKIGVSARASAMGEAFCAVADDVSSIYYNPAGLVQIKQRTSALMHTDWLEEVNYEFLAYAEPYTSRKTFGLSLNYLGMSKMERKDINNVVIGDFDAGDFALGITYAQVLNDKISAGANLKFIQQELEEEVSSGVAGDVGILYNKDNLSFGACVSNFGTKIKFIKEEERLPLNLKLGLGYKLLDKRVVLALDVNRPIDNDLNFGVGTEYQVTNNLFVRAGYNSRNDSGNGVSLGCGFKVGNFQVDYCFLPYEQIGDVSRFSLQFKLSETIKSHLELSQQDKPLPATRQASGELKQSLPEDVTSTYKMELKQTFSGSITSTPNQAIEESMSNEFKEETKESMEEIKKLSNRVIMWIKGNEYKITEEAVSGGRQVWLRIDSPDNHKKYLLEKGTQVKYLGEKKREFYKVVVTTEGQCKGKEGWIWGSSFEKVED